MDLYPSSKDSAGLAREKSNDLGASRLDRAPSGFNWVQFICLAAIYLGSKGLDASACSPCLNAKRLIDNGSVQIQFDIPDDVALQFSQEPGGVGRAAVEALAIEGVRSGRLTEHQARVFLGITTRYEMDGFLKAHGIFLPDTLEDILRDCETAAPFVRK